MNHLDGKMKRSVKVDAHILSDKFLLISRTINLSWTKHKDERNQLLQSCVLSRFIVKYRLKCVFFA